MEGTKVTTVLLQVTQLTPEGIRIEALACCSIWAHKYDGDGAVRLVPNVRGIFGSKVQMMLYCPDEFLTAETRRDVLRLKVIGSHSVSCS